MQFNLIDEEWIPVKRRDGTETRITPWQVTDGFAENPIVSLNAPRPDFNGALIQFLIGLVQTTFAPANRIEWKHKLRTPPSTDQLKTAFMTVHNAFELGGDGPRFMQDHEDFKQTSKPIDWLLIGAATKNTIAENIDHFIKRSMVSNMCPSCCTMALLTMQTNAPGGGQGYRTSLRGGGPLTTLIIGDKNFDTLWHTMWLNVLESKIFLTFCNSKRSSDSNKFPWLAKTKTSVTEQDIHPAQYFWAMPRRIRLGLEKSESGLCDVCALPSNSLITACKEVNKGTEYRSPMKHPLSPFDTRIKKNQKEEAARNKALLTQSGGVSYRHWLGIVVNDTDGRIEPARIVHEFIERQQSDWQFRLWAFGYDFVPGQSKARCWYDSKIPLITVEHEHISDYENKIATLIKAANIICGNLKIAIKKVLHGIPEYDAITRQIKWKYQDIKRLDADDEMARERVLTSVRTISAFTAIEASFWQTTEAFFYSVLLNLSHCIRDNKGGSEFFEQWQHALCTEALKQFDSYILSAPIEDMKIKHVALAQKELNNFNRGTRVRKILGLS
jgi:CRISPR system Cascade subunit CasA